MFSQYVKVILCSNLILKKMNKRITEVIYQQIYKIYNERIKAEISRSLNIQKLKKWD